MLAALLIMAAISIVYYRISWEIMYSGPQVNVDFYIMSHCGFGLSSLNQMAQAMKELPGAVNLSINYIVRENSDGGFESLHGPAEVEENIRQLCTIKYYPDPERYIGYILCQGQHGDPDSCMREYNLDTRKILECANSEEGKALLRDSLRKANSVRTWGSPTIYIGGELHKQRRTRELFIENICSKIGYAHPDCVQ
jgi:hypothetical protein